MEKLCKSGVKMPIFIMVAVSLMERDTPTSPTDET